MAVTDGPTMSRVKVPTVVRAAGPRLPMVLPNMSLIMLAFRLSVTEPEAVQPLTVTVDWNGAVVSVCEPTALTAQPASPGPENEKSEVSRFLNAFVKLTVSTRGFAVEPSAVVAVVGTPVTESTDGGPISTFAVTVCEDTKDDPPGMPPYSISAEFVPAFPQLTSDHFPRLPTWPAE